MLLSLFPLHPQSLSNLDRHFHAQALCGPQTIFVLAHRHRREFSVQLLEAIEEHFALLHEISADDVDPHLRGLKHNMVVRFYRKHRAT